MLHGRATYKRGTMYFDPIGWNMIKAIAKKKHKSPKTVVTEALLRYIKRAEKERMESSSVSSRSRS